MLCGYYRDIFVTFLVAYAKLSHNQQGLIFPTEMSHLIINRGDGK